jgi:hypothetical protein
MDETPGSLQGLWRRRGPFSEILIIEKGEKRGDCAKIFFLPGKAKRLEIH